MNQLVLDFFMLFLTIPILKAQQSYSGNSVMDCHSSDATDPSSAFLYTCNSKKSCQAFLIYKTQTPYVTISSIAKLTSTSPFKLARINKISGFNTILPENKEVLIPVTCSCSGQYYQANTSYVIPSIYDTYFTIANDTYQGLSSCNSLMRENNYSEFGLDTGIELRVPLRCACPTSNQTVNGTKYLLTYLVNWGDNVVDISKRFNVSVTSVAYANRLYEDDPTLFPFTTLLIPLSTKPSSSQTIIHYPPPPNSSPYIPVNLINKSRKRFHHVWIVIILGIGLLVLSSILFVVLLLHKKKWFEVRKAAEGKKKSVLPEDFLDRVSMVDQGLQIYTFEELSAATNDFSDENRLGGSVYRGIIREQFLAIKRMSRDVSNEVNLLRKINHINLISLKAACEHGGNFYLVYEFMENGSLRDWLRDVRCPEVYSLDCKIQIALDIANGLLYLHNFTNPPYVHKDLSSANILLDRHFRAKIANFSLARSADLETYVNSSIRLSRGTKGYLAPEFMESGLVTPEVDIYALGVILLELITGKEAIFVQDGREMLLSETIVSIMEDENAEAELGSFLHSTLGTGNLTEVILKMINLSLACLDQEPANRLGIANVVSSLSKIQVIEEIDELRQVQDMIDFF